MFDFNVYSKIKTKIKTFPLIRQFDSDDCGATCLLMISRYYRLPYSRPNIRELCHQSIYGTTLEGINYAANRIGFQTLNSKISIKKLKEIPLLPSILHWNDNHFVVLYKISKKYFYVADPALGKIKYKQDEFIKYWYSKGGENGVTVFLEIPIEKKNLKKIPIWKEYTQIINHLSPHLKYFFIILLCMGVALATQFLLPILSQKLVDNGILSDDLSLIKLVLLGYISISLGKLFFEFIRGWLALIVGTKFNIESISEFILRLINLQMHFFQSRKIGDILERIKDHYRIESFCTATIFDVIFAFLTILAYSIVLMIYNQILFFIFTFGSLLYIGWLFLFVNKRKIIDQQKFDQYSKSHSKVVQIVRGIEEIKLNGIGKLLVESWKKTQSVLLKIRLKNYILEQMQMSGGKLLSETKNFIVLYFAALFVIDDSITLGMFISIQYIVGLLTNPIEQFVSFIRSFQDALISFERRKDIYDFATDDLLVSEKLPKNYCFNIKFDKVSFRYNKLSHHPVLNEISLNIPKGSLTAIVGKSGSGKSTILKLLMGLYFPDRGNIFIGNHNLTQLEKKTWRQQCGVVMQDGYIFSYTLTNNISLGDSYNIEERLAKAIQIANLWDVIDLLPKGLNTHLGEEGIELSKGQKQRILIARSVYKEPSYLLFDEATNSLDTTNEKIIFSNLMNFCQGRTVLVIAHRLSTVKMADYIIALENGAIAEVGSHEQLISEKSVYFNLVSDQLDMNN